MTSRASRWRNNDRTKRGEIVRDVGTIDDDVGYVFREFSYDSPKINLYNCVFLPLHLQINLYNYIFLSYIFLKGNCLDSAGRIATKVSCQSSPPPYFQTIATWVTIPRPGIPSKVDFRNSDREIAPGERSPVTRALIQNERRESSRMHKRARFK